MFHTVPDTPGVFYTVSELRRKPIYGTNIARCENNAPWPEAPGITIGFKATAVLLPRRAPDDVVTCLKSARVQLAALI